MAAKNDNLIKIFISIFSVLVGVFGTYLINTYLTSHHADATAETVDGVYVFLKSNPSPNSYVPLGQVASNPLERTIQSTSGKKGGAVVINVLQSILAEISFQNRIVAIVRLAKEEYPNVDGVKFNSDLTSCEAIKFNR